MSKREIKIEGLEKLETAKINEFCNLAEEKAIKLQKETKLESKENNTEKKVSSLPCFMDFLDDFVSNNEDQLTFEDLGYTVKCYKDGDDIVIQKIKLNDEDTKYAKLTEEQLDSLKKDINKEIQALKNDDEYGNSQEIKRLTQLRKLLHSVEITRQFEKLEKQNAKDYDNWAKNAVVIEEEEKKEIEENNKEEEHGKVNISETNNVTEIENNDEEINDSHTSALTSYEENEDSFKQDVTSILDDIKDILVKKNHDYKSSFERQWNKRKNRGKDPLEMVDVRLTDKYERLIGIIDGNPNYVDESIQDTLKDIIGYCTLTLRMLNKE